MRKCTEYLQKKSPLFAPVPASAGPRYDSWASASSSDSMMSVNGPQGRGPGCPRSDRKRHRDRVVTCLRGCETEQCERTEHK